MKYLYFHSRHISIYFKNYYFFKTTQSLMVYPKLLLNILIPNILYIRSNNTDSSNTYIYILFNSLSICYIDLAKLHSMKN